MSPERRERLEALLIALIALHSLGVGVILLAIPEWGLRFGGFGPTELLFFPRQAGAFHLVVAAGYVLEYRLCRGVALLLVAKVTAVVFLLTLTLLGPVPWCIPFSAAGDAGMALAILSLRRMSHVPAEGGA